MVVSYANDGVRWRVFERQMLEKHFGNLREFQKIKDLPSADVCFWRPNTEFTSEDTAKIIAVRESSFRFNVNKPSAFKYSHAKDAAFSKWKECGIPCPDSFAFDSLDEFEKKLSISGIEPPYLIRVNNENTGKGSWLVLENNGALRAANDCLGLKNNPSVSTPGTRAMCVKLIDTISGRKYNHSFRIIVAGSKVICGYARISSRDEWVAITGKFRPDMREEFIYWNKMCQEFCENYHDMIVDSVGSLGLNHQGVDVIMDKDLNPYFLEVQPGYSTGYSDWDPPFYNPSYPDLVKFLQEEEKLLRKEIPVYYNIWLNKEKVFDMAYSSLKEQYEKSIC